MRLAALAKRKLQVQHVSPATLLNSRVVKTLSQTLELSPAAEYSCETAQSFRLPQSDVDFEDPNKIYATRPTASLLASWAILRACRIKSLVNNAKELLQTLDQTLGTRLTTKLVQATFFNHFCAGTNEKSMEGRLAELRRSGILPILNFAAEDDISTSEHSTEDSSERSRDTNAQAFRASIQDCKTEHGMAFAAIKVTALCDPDMLERMATVLGDIGGAIDRGHSSARLPDVMAQHLSPTDLTKFERGVRRLHDLAGASLDKGRVRLLVDAEHSYLQPAIDAIVIYLQQIYNTEAAVVMNTYQCYLKGTKVRIMTDMERAAREGWCWGAKTVRGAYMGLERERAAALGLPSPIQETMEDTHRHYNECVEYVIGHVARGGGAEYMVATHNQASVEFALACMLRAGLRPRNKESRVYFAQLLGMADNLTLPLGLNGYNAYKMCAYGEVQVCMEFLLRRAAENSDVLGASNKELQLLKAALYNRARAPFGRTPPKTAEASHAYA